MSARSRFFTRRRILGGLLGCGAAGGAWMRWWEPGWLKVTRHRVPLWPDADTLLVRAMLERAGIPLLHNRRVPLEINGRRFVLAGLGDWWADEMRPAEAFADHKPQTGVPDILLSHNPDTKDRLTSWPWNLLLCGHTHGGQLSLPFIGTPFAPVRDKRFVRDLHRWNDRWLHITAGVGALHHLRFNCRPEISVLELS